MTPYWLGSRTQYPKTTAPARLSAARRKASAKALSVEEIVAEHQSRAPAGDKVAADQKGLGQPIRARLHGVMQPQSPGAAITEQCFETAPRRAAW